MEKHATKDQCFRQALKTPIMYQCVLDYEQLTSNWGIVMYYAKLHETVLNALLLGMCGFYWQISCTVVMSATSMTSLLTHLRKLSFVPNISVDIHTYNHSPFMAFWSGWYILWNRRSDKWCPQHHMRNIVKVIGPGEMWKWFLKYNFQTHYTEC